MVYQYLSLSFSFSYYVAARSRGERERERERERRDKKKQTRADKKLHTHIREIRYITENLDGGEEQDRTNFISSPAAGGIREELSRGQSARGHRCWYGLVHQCVQRSPSGSIRFCWFCSTQSRPIGRLRLVGQMAGQYGQLGAPTCTVAPEPFLHNLGLTSRGRPDGEGGKLVLQSRLHEKSARQTNLIYNQWGIVDLSFSHGSSRRRWNM